MSPFWHYYDAILFWIAAADLLYLAVIVTIFARSSGKVRSLAELPLGEGPLPKVSVIVPARNEERNIAEALQSLLQLDYDNLELLVVNDRSTDGTGAILNRLAKEHPRLRVVHLTELPPGWLGKNHALQYGAERSSGEWLLFTDADIVFEPTALRRAVRYAEAEGLDHVAVGPQTHSMGWMLEAMVVAFCYMFSLYAMPWKAKNPRSTAHVGIGAFNLVRADVFQGIGGMRPVAMRPDDDLKLGKLIKKNGHRQEFLNGCGMISVEWYASVWQLVVGLEKNVFAAAGYSVVIMLGGILFLFLTNAWPFLAIFLTWGTTRWMYLAAAVGLWTVAARAAREISLPMSRAIAFPVCILIFCYINWRAMWLTLRQGGIRWRETHYSLAELRENVV